MENEKISIIVPVYKVEDYLERCVKSLTEQTYKNLEIILVDDGSPDNCGVLCDNLAAEDDRIKVIHKENGGVSAARNTGIEAATGDYITFVDSDDWVDLDMFSYLYKNAKETDADVSICGIYVNYDDGRQTPAESGPENLRVFDGKAALKETVSNFANMSVYNKIISSKIAKDIYFDSSLIIGEDLEYNYRLIKAASKVVVSDVSKYHYFHRIGSASDNLNENNMCCGTRVFEKLIDMESSNEELLPYLYKGEFWSISTTIIKVLLSGKYDNPGFRELVTTLKKREFAMLKYLDKPKDKIRLIIMCHFMWFYKLNFKLRH